MQLSRKRDQTAIWALVLATVVGLVVCMTPPRAIASESAATEEEELSSEVEILGATKHPIPALLAPQNVSVITRRQIQELNPQDISEVLRLAAGVNVFNKGLGDFDVSSTNPNRDFNNRMVVLIDGKPMMNPVFGCTMWQQLPIVLDSIERVEVIKGPCSAQYGANAFSGVINIVTDHSDPVTRQGRRISTTVGERDFFSSTLRMSEWKKDQGGTLTLRYWDDHGPKHLTDIYGNVPRGFEGNKDNLEKFIGVFDWEKTWGSTTRLSARVSRVHNNRNNYDYFTVINQPEAAHVRDTSTLWFIELFHQITNRRSMMVKLQSNQFKMDWGENWMYDRTLDPRKTDSQRFTELELQGRSYLGKAGYVYGVTARQCVSDGFGFDRLKATIDTKTAYGQMEYQFDQKNLGFVGLLLFDSSQNGFDYSPKVSLLHKLSDKEVVRIGWGRSFRAPEGALYFLNPATYFPMRIINPIILGGGMDKLMAEYPWLQPFKPSLDAAIIASKGNSGKLVDAAGNPSWMAAGNEHLKNEIIQQVDLGWEKETPKYKLKIDGWYSESSDLMLFGHTGQPLYLKSAFTPSGSGLVDMILAQAFGTLPMGSDVQGQMTNTLKQYCSGISVEAGKNLSSQLRMDANVTYQDVELKGYYVTEAGAALTQPPFAPRWTGNLITRYRPTSRDTLTLVGHSTSGMYASTMYTTRVSRIPGYTTWNLSHLHEFGKKKDTSLNLSVKNLFDKKHHEQLAPLDIYDSSVPFGGINLDRIWLATFTSKF